MSFYIFMLVGTLLMLSCMLYIRNGIPVWKKVVVSFALAGIGLYGAHLMSWFESGNWTGRSFFGAVFLAPILMFPVCKILSMNYGNVMDMCAPAECVMLALLKVKCFIDGCCYGRLISIHNMEFRFPSQIVECICAILLMALLLRHLKTTQIIGVGFPQYLVFYGIIRFVLNLFRETTPWIGCLAAGNFWSLVSIILGIFAWNVVAKREIKA